MYNLVRLKNGEENALRVHKLLLESLAARIRIACENLGYSVFWPRVRDRTYENLIHRHHYLRTGEPQGQIKSIQLSAKPTHCLAAGTQG